MADASRQDGPMTAPRAPREGVPAAGRALDVEVAEKVMGFRWRRARYATDVSIKGLIPFDGHRDAASFGIYDDLRGDEVAAGDFDTFVPRYSTDIAAAFEVVEKMRAAQFQLDSLGFDGEEWRAIFAVDHAPNHRGFYDAQAATAPLAICLAALRALENPEPASALPSDTEGR